MSSTDNRKSYARLLRRTWLGYWVMLFVATHVPLPGPVALHIKGGDKVLHFAVFMVLVLLGGTAWRLGRGGLSFAGLWAWFLVYAAYGAIDEWSQQWVGRSASMGDWLADLAGVAVATVILMATGLRWSSAKGDRPPP